MSKSNLYGTPRNYNAARSALEKQTAALLAERRQIENIYQQPQASTKSAYPSLTPIVHHEQRKQVKTQDVVGKLQEIIKLCKQEGAISHEEMREVVKVENEVLNYLQRTNNESQPNVVRPTFSTEQAGKSKSEIPPSFPSNPHVPQTWGKEKPNRAILSEDTLEIIGQIERKALGEILHLQQQKDAIKKQKQHIEQQYQKLKKEFQRISAGEISTEQRYSNQTEINQLRQENKALKTNNPEMDRLRHENKIIRQENQYLNSRLDAIGNASMHPRDTGKIDTRQTQEYPPSLAHGQYSSQIAVYENQLKRATVVINQLRARLSNVPGLEDLHDQGERIRRETSELLRLKGHGGGSASQETEIIRELQDRLDNQERGKLVFLEELKGFKQRYMELQEENRALRKSKVSFDPVPRPISSAQRQEATSPRTGIMKKRNSLLGDYEQTLQELKHVLY